MWDHSKQGNKSKLAQGFTIIEIMIVLAVASLIMLIVFLAVPALRRNADNTNRTSDGTKIATGVSECLADRNNVVSSCDTNAEVIGITLDTSTLRQLTTVQIGSNAPSPAAFPSDNKTGYVYFGQQCNTDGSSFSAGNSQQFVVLYNAASTSGGNVNRCLSS